MERIINKIAETHCRINEFIYHYYRHCFYIFKEFLK